MSRRASVSSPDSCSALAIWELFQITELHGAPLDLYAAFILVCILLGAVIGAVSGEPPER